MTSQPPQGAGAEQRRLLSATAVMASGTMVSRVLGFVRTMLVAFALGNTTAQGDTFTLATVVPNSLYMVFAGGALNTVLVPQIVRHIKSDDDDGVAYVNRIMTAFLLALALVTVVAFVLTPQVMSLWAGSVWQTPRMAPHREALFLMAYLTMPQLFFYGAFFLVGQVLNARDRFGPMMWAPIANNLVQILVLGGYALAWASQKDHTVPFTLTQTIVLGVGSTLGIILQTAVLYPALRSIGFTYRPRFDLRGQGLGETFHLAKWMLGYVLLTQVASIVVTRLASSATIVDPSKPGSGVLAYNEAYLTWILPHSLLTVSLATAMLPSASRLAAAGDLAGVGHETARTLRLATTLLLPATAGFLVLAGPFAQLVFGNGAGEGDWQAVALTLQCFAVGLVPYTIQYVYLRGYYALENTRTPFFLQIWISGLNAVVAWAWVSADPTPATVAPRLALAYSVSYLLGAFITYRSLHRLLPTLDVPRLVQHLARSLLAVLPGTLLAAVLTWLASGRGRVVVLLAFLAAAALIVVPYVPLCVRLGVGEVREVVGMLVRRFGRRASAPATSSDAIASADDREDESVLSEEEIGAIYRDVPPAAQEAPALRTTSPSPSVWARATEVDTASSVRAGDVLDGRYRLDGVLGRHHGTFTWLAIDLNLDRSVVLHILPSGEPRTLQILDHARAAAEVTDAHFLRVLDVVLAEDQPHGSYVVCEWSEGQPLETLLQDGPLSPLEASWLVRELAEGLVALHATGRAHGRLDPATVVVTATGNVKIVGFVVQAALDPSTPDLDTRDVAAVQRRDIRALGALFYAALLGRWPGPPAHGLPGDPLDADGRALPPGGALARLEPAAASVLERLLVPTFRDRAIATAAEAASALDLLTVGADASHTLAQRLRPMANPRRAIVEPPAAVRPQAQRPISASGSHDDTAPVRVSDLLDGRSPATPPEDESDGIPFTPVPPPASASSRVILQQAHDPGRRWLRVLLVLFAVALLGGGVGVFVNAVHRYGSPSAGATPFAIARVSDFDPRADGGDDAESPTLARLAADGDLSTAWRTELYGRSADFNGRKPGVGLLVDLGSVQTVRTVKVALGPGKSDLEIRVPKDKKAEASVKTAADWTVIAGAPGATGEQTLTLAAPAQTRYLLVYLTRLPQAIQGQGFQGSIAEISVSS